MSQPNTQRKSRVCAPGLHQKTQLNHSVQVRRPQPPNARTARRRLSAYMRNKVAGFGTLFVHAGRDAWDWMYDTRAAVLAPEDQDPALLDWSICQLAAPPVLVINRNASQAHLEATARACLRDGARRVLFVGLGTLPMWEAAP
jgi:hypothetical protein